MIHVLDVKYTVDLVFECGFVDVSVGVEIVVRVDCFSVWKRH